MLYTPNGKSGGPTNEQMSIPNLLQSVLKTCVIVQLTTS